MHSVHTLFYPTLRDEIAVIQPLASCGPRPPPPALPPAPPLPRAPRPLPGPRRPLRKPHLEWAAMARLTLPGVPNPSARSPRRLSRPRRSQRRPQPSAILPRRLCALGSRVLSSVSSAPPPPPGASARAEPDGHPGTGGSRASRTSLEPRERRCPPPRGTVGSPETKGCVRTARCGVPAPSSPALRGRCARRWAPLEVPELAGTPPQAPRWYGPPPFKGSAHLRRRRCPQFGCVQTRATEIPALGLGPQGPAAVGMCWEWEHRITAFAASGRCCGACHRKHQGSASNPSSTLLSVLKVPRNKCLYDFPLRGNMRLHRRQPFREVP